MLSKNKKNIKMKNCCLYIIMMLLLASCSEQADNGRNVISTKVVGTEKC